MTRFTARAPPQGRRGKHAVPRHRAPQPCLAAPATSRSVTSLTGNGPGPNVVIDGTTSSAESSASNACASAGPSSRAATLSEDPSHPTPIVRISARARVYSGGASATAHGAPLRPARVLSPASTRPRRPRRQDPITSKSDLSHSASLCRPRPTDDVSWQRSAAWIRASPRAAPSDSRPRSRSAASYDPLALR